MPHTKSIFSFVLFSLLITSCSPMYSAAARSALLRGSYDDAEKFLILADFSDEEKERLITAWCQEHYPDGTMPHGVDLSQLESCFPSGKSTFEENMATAKTSPQTEYPEQAGDRYYN